MLLTGSYRFDGDPTAGLPGSESVIRTWPDTVQWCEGIAGVVNPTGANHAVRLDALRAIGWYRQPVSHVIGDGVVVAGDDWDLGVRIRLSGGSTARVPTVVATSPHRFFADPVGYLRGTAHDGEFRRVEATSGALDAEPPEELALPAVVGQVAWASGDATRSTILHAGAETLRSNIGFIHPVPRARELEQLRLDLGPTAFDQAWKRGAALDPDELTNLASSVLNATTNQR